MPDEHALTLRQAPPPHCSTCTCGNSKVAVGRGEAIVISVFIGILVIWVLADFFLMACR